MAWPKPISRIMIPALLVVALIGQYWRTVGYEHYISEEITSSMCILVSNIIRCDQRVGQMIANKTVTEPQFLEFASALSCIMDSNDQLQHLGSVIGRTDGQRYTSRLALGIRRTFRNFEGVFTRGPIFRFDDRFIETLETIHVMISDWAAVVQRHVEGFADGEFTDYYQIYGGGSKAIHHPFWTRTLRELNEVSYKHFMDHGLLDVGL